MAYTTEELYAFVDQMYKKVDKVYREVEEVAKDFHRYHCEQPQEDKKACEEEFMVIFNKCMLGKTAQEIIRKSELKGRFN